MAEEFVGAKRRVVLLRFNARRAINLYNDRNLELRVLMRHKRKLDGQGIDFSILDKHIERQKILVGDLHSLIVIYGEALVFALDSWQSSGATLKDLCDICNKPYHQALREIGPERAGEQFSGLIFVYNLDYLHDGGDFISMKVDAPLTHTVKECMLHHMVTNHATKEAAHNALEQAFPELMENALYMATDSDGTKRLVNECGEDAGLLRRTYEIYSLDWQKPI